MIRSDLRKNVLPLSSFHPFAQRSLHPSSRSSVSKFWRHHCSYQQHPARLSSIMDMNAAPDMKDEETMEDLRNEEETTTENGIPEADKPEGGDTAMADAGDAKPDLNEAAAEPDETPTETKAEPADAPAPVIPTPLPPAAAAATLSPLKPPAAAPAITSPSTAPAEAPAGKAVKC